MAEPQEANRTGIEGEVEYVTQSFFVVSAIVAAGVTHRVGNFRPLGPSVAPTARLLCVPMCCASEHRWWARVPAGARVPIPLKVVRRLQVHRGWLQESMVYIILGIAVGGIVLLYEGGREQDVSAVRSRAAIALVPAPSYVGVVHFDRLCTFAACS